MHPGRAPAVSLDLVRHLLRRAAAAGLDARAACRAAGVDLATLEGRGGRVSLGRFARLWEAVASRSGDPDFGLHFGASLAGAASGHLFLAVLRTCATLGDALLRVRRYHGLFAELVQLEFREEGDQVRVAWAPPAGLDAPGVAEAVLAAFVTTLRQLTEDAFTPGEVRFRHRRRPSRAHARLLGAEVRFGADADEVVFPQGALALPIATASGALLLGLEPLAEAELARAAAPRSWAERTASVVRGLLVDGRAAGIAGVAARLSLRPRTLQARLGAEGTTYRRILDEVRHALATALVQGHDVPLPEIALRLGFAEQSGFNHAFRRWTGTTPRAFRRRPPRPGTVTTRAARGGAPRAPRGSRPAPR